MVSKSNKKEMVGIRNTILSRSVERVSYIGEGDRQLNPISPVAIGEHYVFSITDTTIHLILSENEKH